MKDEMEEEEPITKTFQTNNKRGTINLKLVLILRFSYHAVDEIQVE